MVRRQADALELRRDAIPTPTPAITLAATSRAALGAIAHPSAPTTKIAAAAITATRRPKRSPTCPATVAPATAPNSIALTTTPCAKDDRPKSSRTNSSAPAITPVP